MLLFFLAVVSGVSQEFKTMALMLLMVILSALLRFYQEMRSEYQAQGLLKFVAARVLVIRWDPLLRKQNEYHLSASELVPGDWIRLVPGDLVPADVEVIEDKEFHVSQAALSGEALPVHKFKQNSNKIRIYSENGSMTTQFHPSAKPSLDRPLLSESSRKLSFESAKDLFIEKSKNDPEAGAMTSDLENPAICLLGSAVISGAAVCRVVRIGSKTLFGQLAELLAKQKQRNPFERGVRNISKAFFWTSISMATVVFLLQGLLSGKWYSAVIFGLSVAVGKYNIHQKDIEITNLRRFSNVIFSCFLHLFRANSRDATNGCEYVLIQRCCQTFQEKVHCQELGCRCEHRRDEGPLYR